MFNWFNAVLKEFKEFSMKGNVLDLAVGIIVGGAFGKIVTSLVNDILMPPIGLLLARVNFSQLYFNLSGSQYGSLDEARLAGAPTINYGMFLNNLIDFIIVSFSVFILVRGINRLRRGKKVKKATKTKDCPFCLSAIPAKAIRCPHCTSKLTDTLNKKDELSAHL